jgi:hypothetical protein
MTMFCSFYELITVAYVLRTWILNQSWVPFQSVYLLAYGFEFNLLMLLQSTNMKWIW